jgi:DNA adenine methylase
MKYMGSKDKISKYIIPFLMKNREKGQWYVEPFVGGANMIDKMDGNRIGADVNYYLISLFIALQNGWKPPKQLDERTYNDIKTNKSNYDPELVAFVGFACSYGAKWFGGYCRSTKEKRDYIDEAFKNMTKQPLKGIDFKHSCYLDLDIPENSVIYCDPPYQQTTEYKTGDFNHSEFWQWCRDKRTEGHKLYISEYQAPCDFVDIWQLEKVSSLGKDTGSKKGREKLFVHKDDYQDQFYF